MLERTQRKKIKEILCFLVRENENYIGLPTYYLPFHLVSDDKELNYLGETVKSLHGIPQIPWPDDECIVISEMTHYNIAAEQSIEIIILIRSKELERKIGLLPKEKNVGDSYIIHMYRIADGGNFSEWQKRAVHTLSHITMTHIYDRQDLWNKIDDGKVLRERILEVSDDLCEYMGEYLGKLNDKFGRQIIDTEKIVRRAKLFMNKMMPIDLPDFWLGRRLGEDDRNYTTILQNASEILAALVHIAVPCHYMIKTKLHSNIRASKNIRQRMKEHPLWMVINYDRVFWSLKDKKDKSDHPLKPHKRRGHIRNLWKLSGINKEALPHNSAQRMKLAYEKQVRRIYVQPTLVGFNKPIVDEDFEYRIVHEEIELKSFQKIINGN